MPGRSQGSGLKGSPGGHQGQAGWTPATQGGKEREGWAPRLPGRGPENLCRDLGPPETGCELHVGSGTPTMGTETSGWGVEMERQLLSSWGCGKRDGATQSGIGASMSTE